MANFHRGPVKYMIDKKIAWTVTDRQIQYKESTVQSS